MFLGAVQFKSAERVLIRSMLNCWLCVLREMCNVRLIDIVLGKLVCSRKSGRSSIVSNKGSKSMPYTACPKSRDKHFYFNWNKVYITEFLDVNHRLTRFLPTQRNVYL